jgi:hypothetical protein
MKYYAQPNQYVDPNVNPQYIQPNVIQPNVIVQPNIVQQQPFVDTSAPLYYNQQPVYHQYNQAPQFTSPILSTSNTSGYGYGKVDHQGNLRLRSFPWFNMLFGLTFGLIPLIVMIALLVTLRVYYILWMLIFPVIGGIFLLIGKIETVTLDKYQRKLYATSSPLVCCCLVTRKYEVDFSNIRDIQCEINYNVRVNRVNTGKWENNC